MVCLRGIVMNLAEEAEGGHIAEALLRERLAPRDLALAHLDPQRDAIDEDGREPLDMVEALVDKALASNRGIDCTFWLLATADAIANEDPTHRRHLLRIASRRIHATFAIPHQQRLAATRFLFAKVIVIDWSPPMPGLAAEARSEAAPARAPSAAGACPAASHRTGARTLAAVRGFPMDGG